MGAGSGYIMNSFALLQLLWALWDQEHSPGPPSTENPAPQPIGTVTRVKLELFTGQTEADEPISFDGQSLTLPSDTQFDPSKPIKVVTHGWHQSSLDTFGNVVVDSDEYPRSFNQLYMDSGYDFFGNPDWFANHFRAVELYRESIGSPSSFHSWKCSQTYEEFVENARSCPENSEKIPLGEHSVAQGRPSDGLYYLTSAGVSPYSV